MAKLGLLCRTATTFTKDGEIDEEAMRQYIQRFVDVKMGVYVGSGGSGEGHALKREELKRIYKIGVAVCKGKVPINANPPEQHTARQAREHSLLAAECGVEVVNIYGPTMLHGYKPTDAEILGYYDDVLSAVKHPVALAPNPVLGYTPKPALIAEICRKHRQVVAVNLASLDDAYLIALKDMITRDIEYYVPIQCSPHTYALGATGLIGGDLNMVPKTFRRYADLYERRDFDQLAVAYAEIMRAIEYLRHPRWFPSTPRGLKLAMKVLKLPGGEGGMREPYRMPAADVIQEFADGLVRLRVPELLDEARAAGLSIPA